jgi:uncharacterized membrane protein
MKVNPHRSSLGMDANIMALLCYLAAFVLGWIPIIKWVAPLAPLVIFFIEKESPFVKFHAMQAFILQVISWIIGIIVAIISAIAVSTISYSDPFGSLSASLGIVTVLSVITVIIGIILTIFDIIAMVKAHGYFEYKIPVVGNLSEKFSKKGGMPR